VTIRIPLRARDGSIRAHALVDDEDAAIADERWHLHPGGYAARGGKGQAHEYMHRRIVPDAEAVDHVNGDKLDNRRANLRTATQSQNLMNRGRSPRNTSGYKGVTWHKGSRRWMAQIKVRGRSKCLGYFEDPAVAHAAYTKAAAREHGEFARTA
jgi:hypothetical protein